MQLCRGVSRCSGKLVRLSSFNKPGLPLSIGVASTSVPGTSGRQAPPAVFVGARSSASRAASAIRSTVIHEVPSDGFSKLESPRITLVGNLGRDVEIKQVNGRHGPLELGTTSLAITQGDATTLWVKLAFWNDNARAAAEMLRKGMKVEVFGVLKQSSFVRRDGTQSTSIDVSVTQVRQVEYKKQQQPSSSAGPYKATMGAGDLYVDVNQEVYDDDIQAVPSRW